MTVSYHGDLCSSSSLSFFKILFRWRGSIWKSVATELFVWTILYYKIRVIYRSDWILTAEGKRTFEAVVELCNEKLDYIPLAFMLGFFVNIVVDRWKQIFANMGWIENEALFVGTYVRGDDPETRTQRRNLVRYLCLSQVLVFRDISMRVRRRFPTMNSVVKAGFLLPNELEMLNKVDIKYNKYFVPFNWVFALIYKLRKSGKVDSDSVMNAIFKELLVFRGNLAELCNYDWVPVPLAYCQVVVLAVRVYFAICLIARQYIFGEHATNHVSLDLRVPFMTMLQFIFYVGWVKVAESLLNPMGEDDDDFEGNFLIDKNITTALRIVDEGYDAFPEQKRDAFINGQEPLYSSETANCAVNELVGSVSLINLTKDEDVTMIPRKSECVVNTSETRCSTSQKLFQRIGHLSLRRPRTDSMMQKGMQVGNNSNLQLPNQLDSVLSEVRITPADLYSRQVSMPASLTFARVDEVDEKSDWTQQC